MNRSRGFTLIELMIVVVVIGILAAIAIPNFISMSMRAKEAGVKSNVHTLQLAVEDYGEQNNHHYPDDFNDTLPNGNTVLDLLPEGEMLENSFTREKTEPSKVGGNPMNAGGISYTPIDEDGDGNNEGYTIKGAGIYPGKDPIITLSSA